MVPGPVAESHMPKALRRRRISSAGRTLVVAAFVSLALATITNSALAGRPHSHPFRGSATLVGTIRSCGAIPRSRCRPVTAHVTATKDHGGGSASGTVHGKFSWRVRAGHYTVVAVWHGFKETRHVFARRHQTTQVRVTFNTK